MIKVLIHNLSCLIITIVLLHLSLLTNVYAYEHSDYNNIDSINYIIQKKSDDKTALITNPDNLIPLKSYKNHRQLNIVTGKGFTVSQLKDSWEWYSRTDIIETSVRPDYIELKHLKDTIESYHLVFIHIMPCIDDNITQQVFNLPEMIKNKKKLVLILYDEEKQLERLSMQNDYAAIIIAFESKLQSMRSAVKGIFGGIGFKGKTASGEGIKTNKTRINYCSSWALEINPEKFTPIDSIVENAIANGAFPGCQIFAIWKGNVLFEKSYGHHTYEQNRKVKPTDIYDVASITKILATTSALIKLHNESVIDINKRLGNYYSFVKGTDKEKIVIRDILAHRSGLFSWLPFYRYLMTDGKPDSTIFSNKRSIEYSLVVSENLYIKRSYTDTMLRMIIDRPLGRRSRYLYSDLGMIMLKFAIEETTNTPFEEYLEKHIYDPLNLYTIGFNPTDLFSLDNIVPTENDNYFRNTLIHGYVHDPAAAMMGGVAGHAGLFANARDVGILMYTLSNNGIYGTEQIFDPLTIDLFNTRHFYRLRRGLGFDKPESLPSRRPNVTPMVSQTAFGHSGFTGTVTWADPHKELVYVFLSNRVHPDGNNPLLMRMNIRNNIHEILYEIINEASEYINE